MIVGAGKFGVLKKARTMANDWWKNFKEWAAHPFSQDMPASHWFLLIGMVIVFVVIWNVILYHVIEAIREA